MRQTEIDPGVGGRALSLRPWSPRRLRDSRTFSHVLIRDTAPHGLMASAVQNPMAIDSGRRLQARVYLERGFVDEGVVVDGVINDAHDPHVYHADYFETTGDGGRLHVSARQLRCQTDAACGELPLIRDASIAPAWRTRLQSPEFSTAVEISALARASGSPARAVLLLYRAMWQHSRWLGHGYWVMACEPRLLERLTFLFGRNLMVIGSRSRYTGGDIIPVAVALPAAEADLRRKAKSHIPSIRREAARFLIDVGP